MSVAIEILFLRVTDMLASVVLIRKYLLSYIYNNNNNNITNNNKEEILCEELYMPRKESIIVACSFLFSFSATSYSRVFFSDNPCVAHKVPYVESM